MNEAQLVDILRRGTNLNKFIRKFYDVVYLTDCKKNNKDPVSFRQYKTAHRQALALVWRKGLQGAKNA